MNIRRNSTLLTGHYDDSIAPRKFIPNCLPQQNENYLCVPSRPIEIRESNAIEFSNVDVDQSLKRIESFTLLSVPNDFKFAEIEIKLHQSRWIMCGLCVIFTSISCMQWIQFSIIANLMMEFYQISALSVDWTSMIFMVTYIVLVLPISYYLETKSLRQTALLGCFGTAIGAWFKIYALDCSRFYMLLLGQFIVAVSQIAILIVPTKLSSTWFSPDELFTVSSLGAFGTQLGTALGFFITPWIARNHKTVADISHGLENVCFFTAGTSTIIACVVFIVFAEQPKYPPSSVQAIARSAPKLTNLDKNNWINMEVLKDRTLLQILIAYGVNTGVLNSFSTLLNQIILDYFPDSEQDAGNVGVLIIITGLFGSLIFGIIMDTMQQYKSTAVWVSSLSAIGMCFFCLALESKSKILLYVSSVILGFFMTGYQTVGHELALEVIFPYSESSVTALLNISAHCFGILLTLMLSYIELHLGNRMEHICFILLLTLGTLVLAGAKFERNRKLAHTKVETEVEKLAEFELEPISIIVKIHTDKS